mmetsp:Transcript_24407/g.41331  ORF Transcript_24407/g.41331 Transcript_24407/m.41331 type:complete len:205 (+) Transcript_24407:1966-2580(+)
MSTEHSLDHSGSVTEAALVPGLAPGSITPVNALNLTRCQKSLVIECIDENPGQVAAVVALDSCCCSNVQPHLEIPQATQVSTVGALDHERRPDAPSLFQESTAPQPAAEAALDHAGCLAPTYSRHKCASNVRAKSSLNSPGGILQSLQPLLVSLQAPSHVLLHFGIVGHILAILVDLNGLVVVAVCHRVLLLEGHNSGVISHEL